MRRCLVPVLIALLAASTASAQGDELQPGARVRISAPGIVADRYEGTLLSRSGDTLVIGSQNALPVRVPSSRISSLELSRGKSRADGAVAGMKWGVPIMAGFGLLLAAADPNAGCSTCTRDGPSGSEIVGYFVLSGAAYGAGIGALIGKERWERFEVGARTSLEVRNGRFSLGLSRLF
jgi:hypothetical protein